jgi:hypothetical protein
VKWVLSDELRDRNGLHVVGHPFTNLGPMRNVIRAIVAHAPQSDWPSSSRRPHWWKVTPMYAPTQHNKSERRR